MYTDHKEPCILQTLSFKGFVMKFIDRTGQVFGKLTVLEQAGRDRLKKVLWRCRCECGGESTVNAGSLVTGNTTSLSMAVGINRHTTHGEP